MKNNTLNYRDTPVTDQDYKDVGLTEDGVKRARNIEPRIRELLAKMVEDNPGASPHDITSFVRACVNAVGHSRDLQFRYNRETTKTRSA